MNKSSIYPDFFCGRTILTYCILGFFSPSIYFFNMTLKKKILNRDFNILYTEGFFAVDFFLLDKTLKKIILNSGRGYFHRLDAKLVHGEKNQHQKQTKYTIFYDMFRLKT